MTNHHHSSRQLFFLSSHFSSGMKNPSRSPSSEREWGDGGTRRREGSAPKGVKRDSNIAIICLPPFHQCTETDYTTRKSPFNCDCWLCCYCCHEWDFRVLMGRDRCAHASQGISLMCLCPHTRTHANHKEKQQETAVNCC